MKKIVIGFSICTSILAFGQKAEDLIPQEAVSVFSINNISILKKVSMDELVKYEFMSEVQSEIFDGSTNGKTLKDSGIDFDQKLNAFYGQNKSFEIAGFTFGIKDKEALFAVFDDFDKIESQIPGVESYINYSNHLFIKGNVGIVLRIDPVNDRVSEITDSIWAARGYEYIYNQYEEEIFDDYGIEEEYEYEEGDEMESDYEGGTENIEESELAIEGEESENDLLNKTYWEMRDSITDALRNQFMLETMEDVFLHKLNLIGKDPKFAEQLQHTSDGIFYMDNSRNFSSASGLWQFQSLFPELFKDVQNLYTGNVLLGDIVLKDNAIVIDFESNYGKELGSIYQKLSDTKFDKNVLKYIHKNNTGFFAYNINLKEAYRQAYDVIIPVLSEENDPRISSKVLMAELINDFVDIDAVFETYQGSMFGTFNGIKKVKTTRIEFFYDEETFEYGEKEVESDEEMPVFTMGFTTKRGDIPAKVLKHLSKLTSRFKNEGNYWVMEDAIFNSVPMYIINKNDLLIFTNDEDLALNHAGGYGGNALSGKAVKKAKSSKFMYAHFDWGQALSNLPREMFNSKQNEILDSMRGKTGVLELTSTKPSNTKTEFHITYDFEGEYDNAGKYLLDLVNSVYVLTK